jgi:hypothetical protein
MKKLKHITEVCREIYEKEGFSAVCDYANKILESDSLMKSDIAYECCKACNTDAPAWRHVCLACGQETTPLPLPLPEQLRAEAQELIDGGNSHEKREGYGMMKVLDALTTITAKFCPEPIYFHIIKSGWDADLQRQQVEINCGDNGKLLLIKTDEGFVVDVYGQNDIVDTMAVWEDTLNPLDDEDEPFDPNNFSMVEKEDFIDEWGQYTDEVCAELGYDEETSDDLLMVDYFFHAESKKWIPKCSSLYTEREQAIADYLKLG